MNSRIITSYPLGNAWRPIHIFGYASKGLPGLEIIGLGKNDKLIKEKFIFLTRRERMKLPLKRYVICLEEGFVEKGALEWIELPMLLLFWAMARVLPIVKLDDCFSIGRVKINGMLEIPLINNQMLKKILATDEDSLDLKIISSNRNIDLSGLVISLEDLVGHFSTLSVKLVSSPASLNRKSTACSRLV